MMMLNENISNTINLLLLLLSTILLYNVYRNYYWLKCMLSYCTSEIAAILLIPISGKTQYENGFVGRIIRLLENLHPIGSMWINCRLHTVVSDPETIELLLKKHISKGQSYSYLKPYFGNSILVAPADMWRKHKKLINPTFSQSNLDSYLGIFIKHSQTLVKILQNYQNVQVDVFHEFCICTFRMIVETKIGVEALDLAQQDECVTLISKGQKLFGKRFYNLFLHFDLLWKLFGYAKEEKLLAEKSLNHVTRMIRSFETKKTDFNSKQFLNLLMKLRDEQNIWTDEEMLIEVQGMVIVGSETSAVASGFTMLMVAIHQGIQDKVHQELFEIFGNGDRDVTLKDLEKMDYLDRVIKETLRIFPVVPAILRRVHEDVKLGNSTIPKGRNLVIPIISVHRNPAYWPDPLKFDPDRFLPEEVAKRPRYAFMPFSVPPRNCMGMKFSETSMKVMLSTILRRFKVTTQYDSVASITLNMNVILTAANGFGVTLTPK